MSLPARAYAAWTRFWHTPPDVRVVAFLRVAVGLLAALSFALQLPYVETWWGERGMLPAAAARKLLDRGEGSLLFLLPATRTVLWTCWGLAIAQAMLLAVGWQARVQAACLYVWLVTFQNRNTAICDGEDGVLRLVTFFLIFLPLSDVFSVDDWLRRRRGRPQPAPGSGWALRMIQVQVAFVFWVAGLEKLPGHAWVDGTAMIDVLHLDDFHGRLPEPAWLADSLTASRLMSWGTLALELLAPLAVWFRPTRRVAMGAAIAFHLALDWMMNLYLFEWIMIVGWLAFLDVDADLGWLRRRRAA